MVLRRKRRTKRCDDSNDDYSLTMSMQMLMTTMIMVNLLHVKAWGVFSTQENVEEIQYSGTALFVVGGDPFHGFMQDFSIYYASLTNRLVRKLKNLVWCNHILLF